MDHRAKQISDWLRARVTAAGARGLVVGLSGGLDSAVVARLCQMAAPGQVVGVILPCHSDPRDETDARAVADHFGVPAIRIDLQPAYDLLVDGLRTAIAAVPADQQPPASDESDEGHRVPLSNIKPRLRMTTLYYVANTLNYLVAGTGNRSELTIGYFTKHGDGGVDLLPLGGLLKSEVRMLAADLGVPPAILDKPPSAGLWAGQTDEAEMGFGYADLERYLVRGPEGVAPALALRLERMIRASEHKRGMAPTPEGE
jgi:NAD+ synthase